MIYTVLAALVLAGLLVLFFSKKKSPSKTNDNSLEKKPGGAGLKETKLRENIYEELKRLAYNTNYNDLKLPDPDGKEILYGVLMDWDYEGRAIITLVSFKSGDASIYFSTGTMMIGAGQHAEANQASKKFIEKAEALLQMANNKDTALTSEKGMLKFYLLTNKGKYTVKDKMVDVYNRTSPLTGMFDEANKLITYIRVTEEKMQQQKSRSKS